MSNPVQETLFDPEAERQPADPVLAVGQRSTDYPDRTVSTSAEDQGWAPGQWEKPPEDEDHPRRKPEAIEAKRQADDKRHAKTGHREARFTGEDQAVQKRLAESDAEVERRQNGSIEGEDLPPSTPDFIAAHGAKVRRGMAAEKIVAIMDDPKLSKQEKSVALALLGNRGV